MPVACCGPSSLPHHLAQRHFAVHLPRLDARPASARRLDRLLPPTMTALHGVTESKKVLAFQGALRLTWTLHLPSRAFGIQAGVAKHFLTRTTSSTFLFYSLSLLHGYHAYFFYLLIWSCHAPTLSHAAYFSYHLVITIAALLSAASGAPQRSHEARKSSIRASQSTP